MTHELELGAMAVGAPGQGERLGAAAEADGYDIALLSDSQNLRGDPYGQLALMARSTERVRIGTGVTNPVHAPSSGNGRCHRGPPRREWRTRDPRHRTRRLGARAHRP